jgi:endoglucanase
LEDSLRKAVYFTDNNTKKTYYIMKGLYHYLLIFGIFFLTQCSKEDEPIMLIVSQAQVDFGPNGGNVEITISTTADSWNITNPVSDWLNISSTSGSGGNTTVTLSVSTRSLEARSGTLTVDANGATPVQLTVTQSSSDFLYALSADLGEITFENTGGPKSLKIITDAPEWSIAGNMDWLEFSQVTGVNGSTTLTIAALGNASNSARMGVISISASNAATLEIPVTQKGSLYPNYNTSPLAADATGMTSNAVELAAKINLGLNIGNTLEAIGGETAWGNPKITKDFIDLIKQNGFNAVRLPCSWNQYMENSSTAQLKTDWLNRVKEVVQYCIDSDMYVILNIHWDGGWLENNCTTEKQVQNNAKQKAFWEQIATQLRDFDEHVLFASANEPNVENATQMSVLKSYHQTFINAVRSTGGRNSYRVLVVQGPSTDIEKTNSLMSTLPTDQAINRLMVEIHYYTPYQFCLMGEDATWGKMFYYWGAGYHSTTDVTRNSNWGEESDLDGYFQLMKTKFVDQGIPVVLGEYAAIRRTTLTGNALTLHLASRAYYMKYVTQQALANGLLPFYWDAGGLGDKGSGIFNRQNNTVFDQQVLNAILEGAQ